MKINKALLKRVGMRMFRAFVFGWVASVGTLPLLTRLDIGSIKTWGISLALGAINAIFMGLDKFFRDYEGQK